MPDPSPTTTRRRALVAVLATVSLALGVVQAPAASAGQGHRAKMLRLINQSRERHDLHTLSLDTELSRDARKHTRTMIRQASIFDPPNLQQILAPYPWDEMGAAAVGCDDTVRHLHRTLMRSPVHREILLHPNLRWVGVGLIETDEANICGRGSFWVTEIFYA